MQESRAGDFRREDQDEEDKDHRRGRRFVNLGRTRADCAGQNE